MKRKVLSRGRVIGVSAGLAALAFGGNVPAAADPLRYYASTSAHSELPDNNTGVTANYNIDSLGNANATGTNFRIDVLGQGMSDSAIDGNNSSNPLLYSSSDQTQLSYVLPNSTGVWTGSSSARGNLATGSVGVADTANGQDISNGYTSHSVATLQDNLTFTIANASASTVTNIGITYVIDGTMTATGSGSAGLGVNNYFGNSQVFLQAYDSQSSNYVPVMSHTYSPVNDGFVSYALDDSDPEHVVFHGVYALHGASDNAWVWMQIVGDAGAYASMNYMQTDGLTLDLPTGVSFTSQSGDFLTASSTPEPSTWAMLLIGFAGIAGWRASRRGALPAA